jgi:hypothetical protein
MDLVSGLRRFIVQNIKVADAYFVFVCQSDDTTNGECNEMGEMMGAGFMKAIDGW